MQLLGMRQRERRPKAYLTFEDGAEIPTENADCESRKRHGSKKSVEREVTRMLDTKNTEK